LQFSKINATYTRHQPENTRTSLLNPWYEITTTTDDDDDVNCDSGGNTSVNNKHTLLKTNGDKNG
jgi:hypothetical protein